MDEKRTICGAKTRSGAECQSKPMSNGRCRMHGGSTPNKAGSIYSKYYTEEEQEIEQSIELGDVDDELRLCRIRLRRVLEAEQTPDPDNKKDYNAIADKLLGRIESLERTRKTLTSDNPEDEEPFDDPNPDV